MSREQHLIVLFICNSTHFFIVGVAQMQTFAGFTILKICNICTDSLPVLEFLGFGLFWFCLEKKKQFEDVIGLCEILMTFFKMLNINGCLTPCNNTRSFCGITHIGVE